jgi:nitrilase
MSAIGEQLATLDSDGHYARPDVFRLIVDRLEKVGIEDGGLAD